MSKEIGRIGQRRYGGVIYEEFLPELRGSRGVEIYREIAKSYVEKNPTMSYVDALAKAWEDNPQLVLQYEEEAGI